MPIFAVRFRAKGPMDPLQEHTIAFTGLKDGRHEFRYGIGDDFFAAAGEDEIQGGDLRATVELDKSPSMLVANIHVEGTVDVLCDHCNAPLAHPVKGDQRQIFRLHGPEGFSDDEEVEVLDAGAHTINLTHYLYECIRLAMPIRRVHPEGQCDPEVSLDDTPDSDERPADPDPRWAALNALKDQRP